MTQSRPKFTRYHFNVLAKEIREQMIPPDRMRDSGLRLYLAHNAALADLALSLAKRFQAERTEHSYVFDPIQWLDACSPDPLTMPLSELWTDLYGS